MAKYAFNYDSGEYEYIERDGFSIDRGEYVYEELFDKTLRKIKEYMEPTEIGNTIGSLIDFSAFACA